MTDMSRIRVVLAGGSGHLGRLLARYFCAHGCDVVVLSHRSGSAEGNETVGNPKPLSKQTALWDGRTLGAWVKQLEGADVLINLAGRSVNCRYTAQNRREILQSRVQSTSVVGEALRTLAHPPRLWMNASTATIYRHSFDRAMATGEIGGNEPDVPAAWHFSIDVAARWEQAFFAAETPRTRKIALRSATVMAPDRGGTFDLLLRLVGFGLGGTAGTGKQYVSWVHDADFVRAIDYLTAHEELEGVVNIAAPSPLPNQDFMWALRRAWGVPFGLPTTKWMSHIGAFFLRTETELILKSRRVVSGRLANAGFLFKFAEWPPAAHDLVRRWREQFATGQKQATKSTNSGGLL